MVYCWVYHCILLPFYAALFKSYDLKERWPLYPRGCRKASMSLRVGIDTDAWQLLFLVGWGQTTNSVDTDVFSYIHANIVMCSICLFMLLHVTAKSLVERSHIQLTTWPDGPFPYVFPCCMSHVQWTAGKEPWLPCSWNKTRTPREIADFRGIFGIDEYTLPWKSENSNDLTVEKKGFDLDINVFHLLPPAATQDTSVPAKPLGKRQYPKSSLFSATLQKAGKDGSNCWILGCLLKLDLRVAIWPLKIYDRKMRNWLKRRNGQTDRSHYWAAYLPWLRPAVPDIRIWGEKTLGMSKTVRTSNPWFFSVLGISR